MVKDSAFKNIKTGNLGGGIYLDVTSFSSAFSANTNIQNTTFTQCFSKYGGAMYVAKVGFYCLLCVCI
jgi:hypothetical protein